MGEGFLDKMKLLIGLDEEEIEENPQERRRIEKKEPLSPFPRKEINDNRVINFHSKNQMKMILLEPKSFDECPKIVDHLKSKKPVILNLEKLDSDLARKVFDFISGAVYALDGNVQKVANNIFLFVPENIDILGSLENYIPREEFNPWKR